LGNYFSYDKGRTKTGSLNIMGGQIKVSNM